MNSPNEASTSVHAVFEDAVFAGAAALWPADIREVDILSPLRAAISGYVERVRK
jgi:hypothetical protein